NLPPPRVELKENYPNPFFPATTIPFTISREVCARGHQPVVSLRVYNVLVQVVAIPVLANGSAERVDSLRLRCGEYRAHWDGKYLDGRREATPGVYYYQLTVDGERFTRKMIAQRKVTSQQ
nr:T9SS type A sorting domain-containing protein [Gemmatimonadales bacterium]